jgi:hypothetical protein
MDGNQPGDPVKAAEAIVRVVGEAAPPLRLALGRDAVEAIRAHHLELAAELTAWEKISTSTDMSDAL